MENIKSISELKLAIRDLENQQSDQWPALKQEILKTVNDLKPANIIIKTIKDVVTSEDSKESLLVSAVSLATGFATKALIVGQSTNPLKRLFGTLVQLSISKLISKHPKLITGVTENVMGFIQDKNKDTAHGNGKL